MVQKPDTESFSEVPGNSRHFQRGSSFYLRVAAPVKLRPLLGWELKWPLQTDSKREARLKINYHSALADALIAEAHRILGPGGLSTSSEAFGLRRSNARHHALPLFRRASGRDIDGLLDAEGSDDSSPRHPRPAEGAVESSNHPAF